MSESYVRIVGYIWIPSHIICAQEKILMDYDIECIQMDNEIPIMMEDIEQWVMSHSGDFSRIVDWYAYINGVEYQWAKEESEGTYHDCVYGE